MYRNILLIYTRACCAVSNSYEQYDVSIVIVTHWKWYNWPIEIVCRFYQISRLIQSPIQRVLPTVYFHWSVTVLLWVSSSISPKPYRWKLIILWRWRCSNSNTEKIIIDYSIVSLDPTDDLQNISLYMYLYFIDEI